MAIKSSDQISIVDLTGKHFSSSGGKYYHHSHRHVRWNTGGGICG